MKRIILILLLVSVVSGAITTSPRDTTVNAGQSITFSVVGSGSGLTYQWYRNDSTLSGETNTTLTFTAQPNNNFCTIRCGVDTDTGSVVMSDTVTLRVKNIQYYQNVYQPLLHSAPQRSYGPKGNIDLRYDSTASFITANAKVDSIQDFKYVKLATAYTDYDRMQFLEGATQASVAFKIRVRSGQKAGNSALFDKGSSGGNGFCAYISGGVIKVVITAAGSNYADIPMTLIPEERWAWVHIVYDGSQTGNANRLKAWVDGNPQTLTFYGTIAATLNASTSDMFFGVLKPATFYGNYDYANFTVWDRAISENEIQSQVSMDGLNYRIASFTTKKQGFGNSITRGVGASVYDSCWLARVQNNYSYDTILNYSWSGHQMSEFGDSIYPRVSALYDTNYALLGYNDMRAYGTGLGLRTFSNAFVANLSRMLSTDLQKVKAVSPLVSNSAGITRVRQWSDTLCRTTTTNDSVKFRIWGSTLYFSIVGNTIDWYGSWDLFVDGDSITRLTPDSTKITALNLTLGQQQFKVTLAKDTLHNVKLRAVGGTNKYCFFDYCIANSGPIEGSPVAYIGNCLRMTATGYASGTPSWVSGSDAAVKIYNDTIYKKVKYLNSIGYKVYYVDASKVFDPYTDMAVDNVHPDDYGYYKIAQQFISVKNSGISDTRSSTTGSRWDAFKSGVKAAYRKAWK